ncbi:hypothetical protein [Polyangium aurulentum]|uniref:hypothetical protein n=1 Tax=Polyangium aurulentum TaxID=2567896 RepID=UPI0010AE9AFB|nr:hypothetical protein [Polyangium aurulentum]UQA55784.1 hypothetical protein E8A73_031195 [Polyangium aurulentum]
MTKRVQVNVGDQVFGREDGEVFGGVREVRRNELVIDIEGLGDIVVPAAAVTAAHDQKVILDVKQLPQEVRDAIAHAHDQEGQP